MNCSRSSTRCRSRLPPGSWAYSNLGYLTLGIPHTSRHRTVLRRLLCMTGSFSRSGMQTRIISEADIIPNRARLSPGQRGTQNQEWVSPSLIRRRTERKLQHSRPRQMGRRPLHREAAQAPSLRSDVDPVKLQRRQAELRPLRTSAGSSTTLAAIVIEHSGAAGIHHQHLLIRRRQAHGRRAHQSRGREPSQHRSSRGRRLHSGRHASRKGGRKRLNVSPGPSPNRFT